MSFCAARWRFCAGLALVLLAAAGARAQTALSTALATPDNAQSGGLGGAIADLLAQARYWQQQGQPAQSLASLQRVLQLAPGNADALALKVKIELAQGDNVAAAQDLATLQQVQPGSSAISTLRLMQSEAANPVDTGLLASARQAALGGQYAQAVTLYQQSFHGGTPPAAYAREYYQTLAGTPAGYGQAVAGLGSAVAANPDDLQSQLAFATVETYQPATRQAGITRLASLSAYQQLAAPAKTAWEQALSYLPENSESVPLYKEYLTKYPGDATVNGLLAAALAPQPMNASQTEDQQRASGFDALNAGRLNDAANFFQAALAANPNDADALGGMGLVKLRQGDTASAQDLLRRAMAANPGGAARWQAALSGAARGGEYQQASSLTRRGDLSGAARALRAIIAGGGNVAGAEAMLANVQTQQGDLAGAAASWRAVLASDPQNGSALVGLGTILASQGDQQGAQQYFQQAEANGQGSEVQQVQAAELRSQAQQADNPTVALALYRAAVAAAPDDPWARLDLARALRSAGSDDEARAQMAELTQDSTASVADLQAAALFAEEDGRPADAAALVARLPPSGMTPDMLAIQSRSQLAEQIANAEAQAAGNPALARQLLVTMAAAPDPDGSRGTAIANALAQSGNSAGAQLAIEAAVAANPGAGAQALLSYSGALLANGQDGAAAQMIQSLQARGGLTQDQQASVAALRSGLAVRASDRLAGQGKLAAAYDQLAPGLAQSPADPALNEALARLYTDDHQPQKALAIDQALLQTGPDSLDARAGAVDAAIAAHDWRDADTLIQDGEAAQPNEPRIWMMAADAARAQGDSGTALASLRTAQQLRAQQLAAQSGSTGTALLASAAPVAVNPFGTAAPAGEAAVPSILGSGPATPQITSQADPLSQQIATQIDDLQQSRIPSVQAGVSVESRSGSGGLDQLETVGTPIVGSYAPGGVGKFTLTATPTFLSAGQLGDDPTSQSKFGSDALGSAALPGSQTAAGIGIGAAYELPWLKLNGGSTPFGFHIENMIGSVELDPSFADGLRFSLSAAREPVTDSLVSYAGTRDPRSGLIFGGVLRERAAGQISMSVGPGYAYAGGGVNQLTGKHVAKNTEVEFGAGGSYPIEQDPGSTTDLGVNITYFAYDKNLRYFTLGQGGYFSPQSYFAATLPLDYHETGGNFTWAVGGSLGVQSYSENRSPYFPIDPALQGQLVSAAANSSYLKAYYPASTNSGIVGGAHGSFEYQLSNIMVLGGTLNYNRSGNWNDAQALLYARYLLDGSQ